jgi:hypothetical protein
MNKETIQKQLKSYINTTKTIKNLREKKEYGYKSLVNMYTWVLNVSASLLKDYKNKDQKLFYETIKEFNFIDELKKASDYNVNNNFK